MPSPQEILADPNFNALPIGERLKVMRTVDPVFAGLPPKDQGTVLYQSAASFHPASDTESQPAPDQGFWSTIGHDIMAIPGGIAHAAMNPGETLANATQARLALRPKAAQALKEGNLSGAAGYGLASVMPFVGPMAAQAGEELGGGQPGQGAAHAAEMLVPAAARIPELRNAVVSDETLGTLGEYLKSKRWMDAKARYQARQGAPTPAASVPPPPAPAESTPAAPVTPSLDELTAGQTGGRYKKFSNAPADVQGNIIKLHNRFAGQQPTPKPVPTTAAPPVVSPPPGMPTEPAPTGQPSIRQEPNRPVFNKQQELGEDYMRQTRLDKEEFVVNYLKSNGVTRDSFESLPLAKKNEWITKINAYRKQINSPLEVAQEPSHVMRQEAKGKTINLSQYDKWDTTPVSADSIKRLLESPMWNAPSQWTRLAPPPPPQ